MALDASALNMPSPSAAPISGPMPAPIAPAPDMSPAPAAPSEPGESTPGAMPSTGPTSQPSKYGASDAPMRPWVQILQGALWGLSGVRKEGRGGFGTGLIQGTQGYTQNAITNQQIRMQSAQAAQSWIVARHRMAADDAAASKDRAEAKYQGEQADALHMRTSMFADLLGATPDDKVSMDAKTPEEANTQGMAALGTAAGSNNGTAGGITISNSPAGFGSNADGHQGTGYVFSVKTLKQNPDYVLKTLNTYADLIGASHFQSIKDAIASNLGKTGDPMQASIETADQANAAMSGMVMVPPPSADTRTGKMSQDSIETDKQKLSLFKMQVDRFKQSHPDADPGILAQFNQKAKTWDAQLKNEQAEWDESPEAQKAKAELDKTKADTAKAQFELEQSKKESVEIGQPDATGFSTPLNVKEYDKRKDSFVKSKEYTTLQQLQGSYQQFKAVEDDLAAGKDMTGAQSVVTLFNAIGISATPLAGKGMRINQNTVEEHVTARGIGDTAYQKFLKLKNGDVITPNQVKDYATIALQVYRDAFVNAANDAHSQGLKADFLPVGNNQKIDKATGEIFYRLAGGDAAKARQMAKTNGWVF